MTGLLKEWVITPFAVLVQKTGEKKIITRAAFRRVCSRGSPTGAKIMWGMRSSVRKRWRHRRCRDVTLPALTLFWFRLSKGIFWFPLSLPFLITWPRERFPASSFWPLFHFSISRYYWGSFLSRLIPTISKEKTRGNNHRARVSTPLTLDGCWSPLPPWFHSPLTGLFSGYHFSLDVLPDTYNTWRSKRLPQESWLPR